MMSLKFEKYLIISDMDGTFLGDKASLLDRNLEAIEYFQKNGGIFTIATGRDYRVMDVIFPNAADFLSGPAILCNGSYLYDFQNKQLLNEQSLDKEEFLSLLRETEKIFPNVGYRISCQKGLLCSKMTDIMRSKQSRYAALYFEEPLEDNMDIQWHKCVFVAEPDTIKRMSEYFKDRQTGKISTIASYSTLFEFLPENASKGKMLKRLKEFYPGRTAICVGDYSNDIDMLLAADVAACPANALDEVKAISTIQLCHHLEGCIADLIYKLDSSIKE